jgi:tRNA threonylcarbamoyladenosine biosynthesis protein TsaB
VNPLTLALDTTREHGSIALARGGTVIEEAAVHAPGGFAHAIYGEIEALLRRTGVGLREVELFAAASGPGSFTGVRVGLACVKGLAEALGRPAAAVSNLRVVASFGTARLRAAVLDARRGEVYGAVYTAEGELAGRETVGKFEMWLAGLPEGVEILSPDYAAEGVAITRTPQEMAAAVARIAAGEPRDPAALDANYVRRSDAELFWKG